MLRFNERCTGAAPSSQPKRRDSRARATVERFVRLDHQGERPELEQRTGVIENALAEVAILRCEYVMPPMRGVTLMFGMHLPNLPLMVSLMMMRSVALLHSMAVMFTSNAPIINGDKTAVMQVPDSAINRLVSSVALMASMMLVIGPAINVGLLLMASPITSNANNDSGRRGLVGQRGWNSGILSRVRRLLRPRILPHGNRRDELVSATRRPGAHARSPR